MRFFAAIAAAALAAFGTVSAEGPPPAVAASPADLIDLVAADFFENSLSGVQAAAVEGRIAEIYRDLPPADRAALRRMRLEDWRTLNGSEKARLRAAVIPRFDNLSESQKSPFRAHAIQLLMDFDAGTEI